jgi:hypothetical protein
MFGIVQINNKGPLSEINTAEPIYKKVKSSDGSIQYVYSDNLIHLLDRFFLTGNYHTLSPEQCRFIYKFLEEADKLTTIDNSIYEEGKKPILGTGMLGYLVLTDNTTYKLRTVSAKASNNTKLSPVYEQLDAFLGSQELIR